MPTVDCNEECRQFCFAQCLAYTAAMPRSQVWISNQEFQGFGCSACNWVFKPSGALDDASLDEMKRKYEAERDDEFAAHVCVNYPKATRPKTGL